MIFIFPMMGKSSRFKERGIMEPKFQLNLHGLPVFDYVLKGFFRYFKTGLFIFIHRDEPGMEDFISKRLSILGVENYKICALAGDTSGQAESVYLALEATDLLKSNKTLTIFNIDSFRLNYSAPIIEKGVSGIIEVFKGEGDGWSFIEPDKKNPRKVIRTTEKERISNLCSNGLYIFSTANLFARYAKYIMDNNLWKKYGNEFYVAPMYNIMISDGCLVEYALIHPEDVEFCGIPEEYDRLLRMNAEYFKNKINKHV